MADVVLNPTTSALLLQDLQNELIKGNRPVVPLSGAALIANCQKLLRRLTSKPSVAPPKRAMIADALELLPSQMALSLDRTVFYDPRPIRGPFGRWTDSSP